TAILHELHLQLNKSEAFRLVELDSNLAATFFEQWDSANFGKDAVHHPKVQYCDQVKMTSPHDIKQNNLYWQVLLAEPYNSTLQNQSMTLYLFNAYYDDRVKGKPAVKVITTTDQQVGVEKR